LIHVVAEDAAYDDAYYQLEQLLATNKIDLQAFLKTSRAIAREQFMSRALIKKISEKLNERRK
jgi:ESCRT-I complex subunit TSG101